MNLQSLIVKSLDDVNSLYLRRLLDKPQLIDLQSRKHLEWIFSYELKYSELPKLERFIEEFNSFGFVELLDYPISDIAESATRKQRNRYLAQLINENKSELENNRLDASDLLRTFVDDTSISGNDVLSQSEIYQQYFEDNRTMQYGIPEFDDYTYIAESNVIWFAGRPETYKTTLCQWLLYRQMTMGKSCLVITNETSVVDFAAKVDSMIFGIELEKFFRNSFTDDERKRLVATKQMIAKNKGFGQINYVNGFVGDIKQSRDLLKQYRPDFLFVDGIYLTGSKDGWTSFAQVSSDTKQIAMDFNIPVIGPLHTSRGNESGSAVQADQIALSDSFLKDSDQLYGLHRESKEDHDNVIITSLKDRQAKKHIPPIRMNVNKEYNFLSFSNEVEIVEA